MMAEQLDTTAARLTIIAVMFDEFLERLPILNPNLSMQNVIIVHGDARLFLELVGGAMALSATGATGPASNTSIDALRVVGKDEEEGESERECSICLEKLFETKEGLIVKEMPCRHKFHAPCIERWLQMHSTCPFCRYNMQGEGEQQ
jgi:Ring finger domain